MSKSSICLVGSFVMTMWAVPALAQIEAPALTEFEFGKSGPWNLVYASTDPAGKRFGLCAMEQIYGQEFALRVGITDQNTLTIDFMGDSSLINERPMPVRYYVDAADQPVEAMANALREGGQDASWRRVTETLDMVGGLGDRISGKMLVIEYGKSRLRFNLAGAAKALESVRTCFVQYNPGKVLMTSSGRPPAPPPPTAAAAPARPAAPPPPDAPAAAAAPLPAASSGGSYRTLYATIAGVWKVEKVSRDPGGKQVFACIGQGLQKHVNSDVRFVIDAKDTHLDWQDSFGAAGETFNVELGFDTDRTPYGKFKAKVISADGALWARISETRDEPGWSDAMSNTKQAWLRNQTGGLFTISLNKSNLMFDKFYECMTLIP